MDYQYRVEYKHQGIIKDRYYKNIKDITRDFNIKKELVKNIYMKVPKTLHPVILTIERLPIPMKQDANIIIDFS